jgi:hypothetical protein
MRYTFLLIVFMISCSESVQPITFSSVNIETVYSDSLSIRAIELMGNSLAFGFTDQGF